MTRRAFNRFMLDIEIGTSRKLRRLQPQERWCFVAGVLAIAAKSPDRGVLLISENLAANEYDYAEQAGVTVQVARSTVEKLRDLGMLEVRGDFYAVRDWDDWQISPRKPSDEPEQTRDRKRKSRAVTRDTGVTRRPVTREVEVEGEEHPLVSAMAEDQHQAIEDWRPLPQRPRSHTSQACDRWDRELATWCAVHIPEVPLDVALAAARQAVDDHRAVTASDLFDHFRDGDYPYAQRDDVRRLLVKHNRHVA